MKNNPFDTIDARFDRLEEILLQIKHNVSPLDQASKTDIGGIEIATEVTGLSTSTIYKLVSSNEVPYFKKRSRLYFSRTALQKWLIDKPKQ